MTPGRGQPGLGRPGPGQLGPGQVDPGQLDPGQLDHARKVADAVLYEGYLLYPYRQSAQKNQARFQFGVLMPPAYVAADDSERSACQTECLAECADDATIEILVRCLQVRRRLAEAAVPGDPGGPRGADGLAGPGGFRATDRLVVDGAEYTPWDEAAEFEHRLSVPVAELLGPGRREPLRAPPGEAAEDLTDAQGRLSGRLVWRWARLDGVIDARAERVAGPYRALRLRVRVENHTQPPAALPDRQAALPHALIAAHLLIGIPGGAFLSLTDPPEWAAAEAAACARACTGTWPVLAGSPECRSLMLSSPVILPDHPEIAPESAGDLFDATEIDEILTLRTLAMTDDEKQQARTTDPRAAALLDRLEGLPAELLERMHGAIRYLEGPASSPEWPEGAAEPGPAAPPGEQVPWWDPGADTTVSPETDHVMIEGTRVARGSRVRMRPGTRRADAQDLFLAGRDAVVEAVLHDVDGHVHVAVSPALDPVAELQRSHGRFLYFAPDEIEPIAPGRAAAGLRPAAPPGHRPQEEPQ